MKIIKLIPKNNGGRGCGGGCNWAGATTMIKVIKLAA